MLAPTEREQLLVSWNATQTAYRVSSLCRSCWPSKSHARPIRSRWSTVSRTLPIASSTSGQTGSPLLASTGRWAVTILVAVCAQRSPELVIGLIGALKAGGAYVPIDPNYPADRVEFMLKDSAARVALTTVRLRRLHRPADRDATVLSRSRLVATGSLAHDGSQLDLRAARLGPMSFTRRLHRFAQGRTDSRTARWSISCARCRRVRGLNAHDVLLSSPPIRSTFSAWNCSCRCSSSAARTGRKRGNRRRHAVGQAADELRSHRAAGHAGHLAHVAGGRVQASRSTQSPLRRVKRCRPNC